MKWMHISCQFLIWKTAAFHSSRCCYRTGTIWPQFRARAEGSDGRAIINWRKTRFTFYGFALVAMLSRNLEPIIMVNEINKIWFHAEWAEWLSLRPAYHVTSVAPFATSSCALLSEGNDRRKKTAVGYFFPRTKTRALLLITNKWESNAVET